MQGETPDSLIPYDEIVQEALRAVVGRVLGEVETTGRLPASIISTSPSNAAIGRTFPGISPPFSPTIYRLHPNPLLT